MVIYISFLCFILFFFFQKAENNRLKKASWSKFCNIIFLFLLKIRSAGLTDQQLNLVSHKIMKARKSMHYQQFSEANKTN